MKIRKVTKKMLAAFNRDAKRYASYKRKDSMPEYNSFVFSDQHDACDFGYYVSEMNDKNVLSLVEREADGAFHVTFLANFDPYR